MAEIVDRALALQLLEQAVADHPRGKAGVSERLGYGRALIARVLSPNDPTQISDKLSRVIIDRYHVVRECPATTLAQPRSECQRLANGHAPTHNPLAMRIWKVCQSCPYKPEVKK